MTYDEAVRFLSERPTRGDRGDRRGLRALLSRLGDPQNRLRTVHLAGTNGKGSTAAFLTAIFQAAGYRVGTYLSPYVFDLRERWLENGERIPPDTLAEQVATLRVHTLAAENAGSAPTTEFELKTALAFSWFAQRAVDIAIIEAGIGGRGDATNVLPAPLVAGITSIGLDHAHLLGDTLHEIATEKAGIVKPGTYALVTPVAEGDARRALEQAARSVAVPVVSVGPTTLPPEGRLGLLGDFQRTNAATAVGIARTLDRAGDFVLPEAAILSGLAQARLPGRFQILQPDRSERILVLDVAHNEEGARALANAMAMSFPERPLTLVLGLSRQHAPGPFLEALRPRRIVATAPAFRPRPAEEIATAARTTRADVRIVEPVDAAIQAAWERAEPDGVVLVTGSFYTVGETPRRWRDATPLWEGLSTGDPATSARTARPAPAG